MYNLFDKNKNNKLTVFEFEAALKNLGFNLDSKSKRFFFEDDLKTLNFEGLTNI